MIGKRDSNSIKRIYPAKTLKWRYKKKIEKFQEKIHNKIEENEKEMFYYKKQRRIIYMNDYFRQKEKKYT